MDGADAEMAAANPHRSTLIASGRLNLGPELPLPVILQSNNRSQIVEQPANLLTLTERLAAHARDFATANAHHPMFLYLALGHVHTATPNISPDEQYAGCGFQNTTKRGRFGDALAEADWLVGNVTDHIEGLGLSNNTLFLFTSVCVSVPCAIVPHVATAWAGLTDRCRQASHKTAAGQRPELVARARSRIGRDLHGLGCFVRQRLQLQKLWKGLHLGGRHQDAGFRALVRPDCAQLPF